MELKTKNKKAQLTVENTGAAVLAVGFIFFIMMTIAFVGENFQDSLETNARSLTNISANVTNSTIGGFQVPESTLCNFGSFGITEARFENATLINTANYTVNSKDGIITATDGSVWNDRFWNLTYTYVDSGISCNVTNDLQKEIGDNTSIAGMVLTIILIGLVLGVLVIVFASVASRRNI